MTYAGARRGWWVPAIAVTGAFVAALSLFSGIHPQPFSTALNGGSAGAALSFSLLVLAGIRLLRRASASTWRWALVLGCVCASADLAGMALRLFDGVWHVLSARSNRIWTGIHWVGTAWMATIAFAALFEAVARYGRSAPSRELSCSVTARPAGSRLIEALRSAHRPSQLKAAALLMAAILALRIPYFVTYWPGLVYFDTFRSYSYARGTGHWDTYEPVGNSLYVTAVQWLGTQLGSDAAGVAIGTIFWTVAGTVTMALMLTRMAVWKVPSPVWWGSFGWVGLQPILGFSSVLLVKDVGFTVAMLLFLVCVGEVSFNPPAAGVRRLWPWITMSLAGVGVIILRNNGVYAMALGVPMLLIPLRRQWKQILLVLLSLGAAFGLYVGPLYTALQVRPGPPQEAYSIPLQQLGRIARDHASTLTPAQRAFYLHTFGRTPEVLGPHYVGQLADPMKLNARRKWSSFTTTSFLEGWAGLVAAYPGTAIEATLANTVGYWDPEGAAYDGLTRWSVNDVRQIHLDIPSGPPTRGIAGALERSGFFPTQTYGQGLLDDGYRVIPVLGLLMSPGPICWAWLTAGLLMVRMRHLRAAAIFFPVGGLALTLLAGPVSGGQRYSLTLFATLPLAAAAVALAARQEGRAELVSAATVPPS